MDEITHGGTYEGKRKASPGRGGGPCERIHDERELSQTEFKEGVKILKCPKSQQRCTKERVQKPSKTRPEISLLAVRKGKLHIVEGHAPGVKEGGGCSSWK